MKVTFDNFRTIAYYAGTKDLITSCGNLLGGLLCDLETVNHLNRKNDVLYIDYIDTHTEYSPDRTDPCPDYYGYFRLPWENEPSETVGDYMTIDELDGVLCALTDFVEYNDISYDEKN
jgi:hypothetical protein